MEQTKSHFDWASLILGIFFILASLMAFQNVGGSLLSLVLCYAIFAIVKGCYELFFRSKFKQLTGVKTYFPIVAGVIDIAVGLYLLFNLDIGLVVLPYVFAIWFIVDSICGLFTLDIARSVSKGYFWFSLVIDILGIIVGIMLLFDPISSVLTLNFLIGFYLMLFGIEEIIYAFSE